MFQEHHLVIMDVSNVGGATIMNEQACVASCVRGYHAYKRYGKQLLARLDCWRELNNRLQRILLAYVFDTASIAFFCT